MVVNVCMFMLWQKFFADDGCPANYILIDAIIQDFRA